MLNMGVNHELYDPKKHTIVSNGSCTTNALSVTAKVLSREFGIKRGFMTTVHSYTNTQRILDVVGENLREARAAALNIIPATTGAAKAIFLVLPELAGKMHGIALRVPTPTVSIVDLVCELERKTTAQEVNAAYRRNSQEEMKGYLGYSEEELVSMDYKSSPYSGVVDAPLTTVIGDFMVKVMSWYDNEWGDACRVADLVNYMALKGLCATRRRFEMSTSAGNSCSCAWTSTSPWTTGRSPTTGASARRCLPSSSSAGKARV